jgi:hypothetical protein
LYIKDYVISFKHDAISNARKHLDRVYNTNLDNVVAQKRSREEDDVIDDEEVQSNPQIRELLRYWWVNNIIAQQRGRSSPRHHKRKPILIDSGSEVIEGMEEATGILD